MMYKDFEIVFDNDTNQWYIKDRDYKQEIKVNSLQAGKIKVSKLIKSREYFRGLK